MDIVNGLYLRSSWTTSARFPNLPYMRAVDSRGPRLRGNSCGLAGTSTAWDGTKPPRIWHPVKCLRPQPDALALKKSLE